MNQRAKFEHNLNVCRTYTAAVVDWLRKVGLDEEVVDKFEAHANTVLAAASQKAPPPAKVINIKDYLHDQGG